MITFYDNQKLAEYAPNAFFNTEVVQLLSDSDKKFIEEFDQSKFLDNRTLKTRFGVCGIEKVSTGVKTILCIKHFPNLVWDLSECGQNVFRYLSNVDFDFKCTNYTIPNFVGNVEISYEDVIYTDWFKFAEKWAINHDELDNDEY